MEAFAFIIVILVGILLVARAKSTVKQIVTITDEQITVAGRWNASVGDKDYELVLSQKGQFVEGSISEPGNSWPIEGSYVAPKVSFETSFADGNGLMFEGKVSPDGKRIDGHSSNFIEKTYWCAKRVEVERKLVRLEPHQTEALKKQQAVQLVYDGLTNVLNSLAPIQVLGVLAHDSATIAAIQSTIARKDSPTSMMPLELSFPSELAQEAVSLSVSPLQTSMTETLDFAPPVAAPFIAAPSSGKKCPKCKSEWQDAFSFCLHCGYTT